MWIELADDVQEAINLAHAIHAAVRGLHSAEEGDREGIALIFVHHFDQLQRIQISMSKASAPEQQAEKMAMDKQTKTEIEYLAAETMALSSIIIGVLGHLAQSDRKLTRLSALALTMPRSS